MDHITIGTRGSKLALAQVQLVIDAIAQKYPSIAVTTKVIATKGDINQAPVPLDTVGKTWFTEEIEQALLAGAIDLAIHSLKDLPVELPPGLSVLPVLERADPRDVLVTKTGLSFRDLPRGAIIGTDSLRRKALLLAMRPDVIVESIRGNVDTRLKKLETEKYDAIVLAAAGLERIGLSGRVTEFFEATTFIPAAGQGILAAETRNGHAEILEILDNMKHVPTTAAAKAEQAFSRKVNAGCKLPVGCYATIEGEEIFIYAMMGDENGGHVIRESIHGPLKNGAILAENLAKQILDAVA